MEFIRAQAFVGLHLMPSETMITSCFVDFANYRSRSEKP